MAHRRQHRHASQDARRSPQPPSGGASSGRTLWRVALLTALAVAVAIVFARKPAREAQTEPPPGAGLVASHAAAGVTTGVPRLVDLGADRCIPCKAMAPILQELRTEYAGRMQVDFIDVWKDPSAGDPYNVYGIPTQIFFDEHGRELTRHSGFLSKADILATWKRVGYDFTVPGSVSAGS